MSVAGLLHLSASDFAAPSLYFLVSPVTSTPKICALPFLCSQACPSRLGFTCSRRKSTLPTLQPNSPAVRGPHLGFAAKPCLSHRPVCEQRLRRGITIRSSVVNPTFPITSAESAFGSGGRVARRETESTARASLMTTSADPTQALASDREVQEEAHMSGAGGALDESRAASNGVGSTIGGYFPFLGIDGSPSLSGKQAGIGAASPTATGVSMVQMGELSDMETLGLTCGILDGPSKKQVCLFFCDETEELARKIAADADHIELRNISWGKFPDGFPNLFVPNAHGIRNRHVAFLASFSSPGVIFEQLSIIYALPRMFVSSFTLVLPFFPTGTQERMEDEGDVATAFTLSRILSNIPISRGGPTSLVIFDIHALQERFYFGDNVLPCFESGIPLLKHRLHQLPDSENVSIAFPDEGAWKRFHRQLQHYPTVICTKVRDGNKRIVQLKEGDPKGRHVVIVDDLVQSGSTLIECQKLLSKLGASRVSAYATHGVFPNASWHRFQPHIEGSAESGFSHFWITDSCALTARDVEGRAPFEVLSLAGPIQAALQI